MSSGAQEFRERLRRMRREALQEPQPEADSGAKEARVRKELPVWMAAKLRARERRAASRHAERAEPVLASSQLQPASSEPVRNLVRKSNEHGSYSERTTIYAADHVHGEMRLDRIGEAASAAYEFFTGDPQLAEFPVARAVYLDTETTGLSGGAGTYVFQVGLGQFRGGGAASHFELWQGFMEGPEDEAALLLETARRVKDSSGVVSFFGKSFDRHRLEDKMRLHGIAPPFTAGPHLDLYHPLRRIFRGRFEDGKLRTMENRLCGLDRPDDLPGAFAPAAWFDYIAGRAHRVEGVFQHNADDVLSLVTLAAWLGQALEGPALDSPALPLARARGHADRKDWSNCESQAEFALGLASREEDRLEAKRLLARSRARTGDWGKALTLWSEAAEHSSGRFTDWIEAAKCCERLKNFERAIECCQAAERIGGPAGAMRDLRARQSRLTRARGA